MKHAVLSVTSFQTSSNAHNVIPAQVFMRGTVRTLDAEIRELVSSRLASVAEGTAAAFGAKAEVTYMPGYPVMTNSAEQTAFAADVAKAVSGQCEDAPQVMGGEDFSYLLNERPGAYILVGNGETAAVHNPLYNFNDEAIPAGCSWWTEIVERRLPLA